MPIQGVSAGRVVVKASMASSQASETSQASQEAASTSSKASASAGPPPGGRPGGPPPGDGAGRQQTQGSTSSSSTDPLESVAKQIRVSVDVLRSAVQQLKNLGESADPLADAVQRLQQARQAQLSDGGSSPQGTSALVDKAKQGIESFDRVAGQMGVESATLRKAFESAIEESRSPGGVDTTEADARRIVGSAAEKLGLDPTALSTAIQQFGANIVSQYA